MIVLVLLVTMAVMRMFMSVIVIRLVIALFVGVIVRVLFLVVGLFGVGILVLLSERTDGVKDPGHQTEKEASEEGSVSISNHRCSF